MGAAPAPSERRRHASWDRRVAGKKVGKPPRDVATAIAAEPGTLAAGVVAEVSVAGPGFLNSRSSRRSSPAPRFRARGDDWAAVPMAPRLTGRWSIFVFGAQRRQGDARRGILEQRHW
ncbi:MAG: hypothetical protein U0235_24950 [Polyangiaceae bacterium]